MGVPVVKFGNKALSAKASSMGSFDFLETLGLALPPHVSLEAQHRLFQSSNLWFLFAPMVYPQLALLQGWRKAFGKPTVFNALGPMLNPMNPQYHWHGVAQPAMASMLKGLAEMLTSHPTSHHPICQRWAWHTTTLNPASAVAFPAYLDEASPEGECHTLAFGETPLGQTTGQDTWKAYTQSLQHQGSPALLPPLLTLDAKLKAFYACLQGTSNTTYTGWQNTVWLNVTGCLWHSGKANTLEEAQEQCRHQVMSGNAYAWYEDVLKPQFLALTD
jgi:anthranilate phosphoribosyltransferase